MKRLTLTTDSGDMVSIEPCAEGLAVQDTHGVTVELPWDAVALLGTIFQEYSHQRSDMQFKLMVDEEGDR